MRVCGVELKGGEAIISLLSYEGETFNVPECRKVSFTVSQSATTEAIREFHFAFHKLTVSCHYQRAKQAQSTTG